MENLFEKACNYALEKHSGQHRKDGSIYILQPFEVATIAGSITTNEEILSAAVLHDVPEECDVEIVEIQELFGNKVAKIVELETEPKFKDVPKRFSWRLRKTEAIKRLQNTDEIGFKIVYLADKLANIRALYRDYESIGQKAFDRFNVNSMEEQAWYYFSVLNSVIELQDTDAYKELYGRVCVLFKDYKEEFINGKDSNTLS